MKKCRIWSAVGGVTLTVTADARQANYWQLAVLHTHAGHDQPMVDRYELLTQSELLEVVESIVLECLPGYRHAALVALQGSLFD